jgi:hypothetical protein
LKNDELEKIWKETVQEFALRDGGEPQKHLQNTSPERDLGTSSLGRFVIISLCLISSFVFFLLAKYPDILSYPHEHVLLMITGTASILKKTVLILSFSKRHHPRGIEQAGVHSMRGFFGFHRCKGRRREDKYVHEVYKLV